jgi:predicted GNAT family acetyltransferase
VTEADQDLEQRITQQLTLDEVYLWNNDGVKNMVTALLPSDVGVELANVFTLHEYRRLRYARACITEVCRAWLQRYPRIVLFADQDNSAAISLYTMVGFRRVAEMNSYRRSKVLPEL